MASSRQKKTPRKKPTSPAARPARSDALPAVPAEPYAGTLTFRDPDPPAPSRPKYLLKNLVINRIEFVGEPGVEPVVIWQKRERRGPGRPRVITLAAFLKDLAAYPDESNIRRGKRLGIDRRTVARLKQQHTP